VDGKRAEHGKIERGLKVRNLDLIIEAVAIYLAWHERHHARPLIRASSF
jgi:hypothetical protein